jgi:hypothetical protein
LAVQGLLAGAIAIALALTALTLRPVETEFLGSVSRPLLLVASVPMVWIVFQVLPLQIVAHPIWASAGAALGRSIIGAASIDPAASFIGLGQYISLCGFSLLCGAVAVDRQRAEWVLFALAAAGAAIGLIVIWNGVVLDDVALSAFTLTQAIDCTALGAIAASTSLIRTIERFETRRSNPLRSLGSIVTAFTISSAALAICVAVLAAEGARGELFAAGCGLAALAFVTIVRRAGFGPWGTVGVALPMLVVAAVFVLAQPPEHGKSFLLAFATDDGASAVAISARVLEDTPLAGTGAETFAAIAPIYREAGDTPAGPVAATAAADLAIELGRPMAALVLAAAIAAIVTLMRAALQRGRDSFYPAMGASALITSCLLAFMNGGLSGNASGLMIAGIFGLAAVQRQSRTVRP